LATLLYETGDAIRALQLLEEGRLSESFNPKESEAYLEKLAWLYLETGNLNTAVEIYKELNRENKATKRIRTAYINALLLNGERDEALGLLTSLSDDFPNDPDIKKSLLIESLRELKNEILLESGDTQLRDDLQSPFQKSQELIERIASLVEHSAIWWSPLLQTAQGGFGYQRLTSEESTTLTDESSLSYLTEVGQLFIELLEQLEQIEQLFPQEFQIAAQEIIITLQNSALPVLERLFVNQSESVDIAEALLELYTELGMKQEADSLQKRWP
jgi:predicted Zn-dependent protease